jgi:YfiH family protein
MATAVRVHHFSFSGDGVLAAVSSRHGGVSAPPHDSLNLSFAVGDDPDRVRENRRRLAETLGVPLASWVVPRQVHAGTVTVVGADDRGRGAEEGAGAVPDCDALVTAERGVALAIAVADCVPVVVVDRRRGVLGAAHAGWRGTVARVAERTVHTMMQRYGCVADELVAGIGPAIGPASYEVGADVVAAVARDLPDGDVIVDRPGGTTAFDLWWANRAQLVRTGIPDGAIETMAFDTFTRTDEFFSHRAGAPTGRFMLLTCLAPPPAGR